MRATDQEQKGGAGSSEAGANFERINWGVAENSKHDLGTDLILMVRDERLIDLGMVIGAQVKAGKASDPGSKYFRRSKKQRKTGAVMGWWFSESKRDHFDYWLAHQLPHLVVLHDLETRTSYWIDVTADKVKYTRKGAKIFVPIENTVDTAHADELAKVAASKVSRTTWEGSAWAGAVDLSPSHQLRHALLTPRLVAPHPNFRSGFVPSAAQAVALLVQVRLSDLDHLTSRSTETPIVESVDADAPWEWQLAGAFHRFLHQGDPSVFAPLALARPHPRSQPNRGQSPHCSPRQPRSPRRRTPHPRRPCR